jgi:hypothetical protein
VDPLVIVLVIVIATPLAVMWALAKGAQLRGPAPRKAPRRPVGGLITDAIPEQHPDEDGPGDPGPGYTIDSPQPEPDAGLRNC